MELDGSESARNTVQVWLATANGPVAFASLMVRTERRDPRVTAMVRRTISSIHSLWVSEVEPYTAERDAAIATRAFFAKVFVTMGTVALGLAALGLYGVLAYAVNQRMREFAVRLALGAQPRQLFRMVMHDGAVMILAGTGVGAFFALAASRLLDAVLAWTLPGEVIGLVACEILLITAGFLAAFTPARRAVKADPLDILRAV